MQVLNLCWPRVDIYGKPLLTIKFNQARLSFNVFDVQPSRYMGLNKPKPRCTFSGYFYLSYCFLILYMYWISIVLIARLFVQAQQQIDLVKVFNAILTSTRTCERVCMRIICRIISVKWLYCPSLWHQCNLHQQWRILYLHLQEWIFWWRKNLQR